MRTIGRRGKGWAGLSMAAGLALVFGVGTGLARVQSPSELPPDVWEHPGDSDGDGLYDSFETAHGLDPQKVESYPDGIPDESRLAADGRTMWEVQEAELSAPPGGGGGGGSGGCGATGIEFLVLLAILRRRG